ncbi:hypothetical protein SPICUR_03605 [Spiribacter curvatus]|uniref:GAF domain-containing protein n=1 Tax=Spiribacter curvatus TaxID=1335757 RepID=U5T5X8_9GAMM|nr:hypothetical protein [Spiribacter curvatus]AGY91713.1 hypothetical protein SPICUR_03605 [Spiribacter curvatus]
MDDQANPLSMDFTPYTDFDAASRAVLHALNMLYPMGAWLMTRVEGDDWLILQSEDNRYIGVPVTDANGALFGTLCAVDTVEKPELTDALNERGLRDRH